jgi:hypothetical protein
MIEYIGLVLFLMIYTYVWVQHYVETRRKLDTNINEMNLISSLVSLGPQILGTCFVILVSLILLISTIFRALSSMSSLGTFDVFSLRLTFGWLFHKRLLGTLVTANLICILGIYLLVALRSYAMKTVVRPVKAATYQYYLDSIHYLFRSHFFPQVSATSETLLDCAMLMNLVVMSTSLLLAYSNFENMRELPWTLFSKRASWTLDQYADLVRP